MMNKKKLLLFLLIFAIFTIIVTVIYQTFLKGLKKYTGYEIEKKEERGNVIDANYFSSDGKLISYNHEGVFAIGEDNSVLWNAGVSYKNPKVITGGEFVTMADIGGKSLSFMNRKSTPVNIVTKELAGKILDISMSERGQVAVLLEDRKNNLIQILEPFNQNTEMKAEIKTYQLEDGYGLSLALSPDGTKLVTEFIKREGSDLKTALTFYNFGKTGENSNADRIVGIFPYKNTIFGKLKFLNNNRIVAVGDNKIVGFSMKYEPNLSFEKGIHGKITKVEGDGSGIALILVESGQKTKKGTDENEEGLSYLDEGIVEKVGEHLLRLNLDGNVILEKESSFKRTGLSYQNGETILYSDEACIIFNSDGSEKFKTTFQENILNIFPTTKKDKYFLVSGNYITIIKLNR